MKAWCVASVLILFAFRSSAALFETVQSGTSTIRVDNAIVADQSDAQSDGRVSVFAIHGTTATAEVRTAARSSFDGVLAANVRMDDKSKFSFMNVTETISAATLVVNVAPDNVFVRRAELDFFLPPSFLEVTSHGELPSIALEMVIYADLRACFSALCGLGDSNFFFQSILTGSWQTFTHSEIATGDASLNLASLQTPAITDVGGPGLGFLRTTTLEFDSFSGHLDLGLIPAGVPFTVEYQLQARGAGILAGNIGLAAINDPFLLETDPLQTGAAITLAIGPVPEPSQWTLLGFGLALLGAARAVRRGGRTTATD